MNKIEFLNNLKEKWFNPDLVSIDHEKMINFNIDVDIGDDCVDSPFLSNPVDIIRFYLALNSINHQFWHHDTHGNFIRYVHDNNQGALALMAGMKKLLNIKQGLDNMSNINPSEFKECFGEMPDSTSRIKILNQALSNKAKELAEDLWSVSSKGWSILEALSISEALPLGYQDEALKKAQLVIHMTASALKIKGYDIKTDLTCFADYQIPRVLRHLGILVYSPEIAHLVDSSKIIQKDSNEEHAIRAATILACEEICAKININPAVLDYWLWSKRNTVPQPFHLTYTNAY